MSRFRLIAGIALVSTAVLAAILVWNEDEGGDQEPWASRDATQTTRDVPRITDDGGDPGIAALKADVADRLEQRDLTAGKIICGPPRSRVLTNYVVIGDPGPDVLCVVTYKDRPAEVFLRVNGLNLPSPLRIPQADVR